jgi:hypothetical protein
MAHLPINHRLGGLYRFLAALAGIYLLAFGIVGVSKTHGQDLFERGTTEALGLRTNLAFSILSIIAGAVVLLGSLVGRNLDHYINFGGGVLFWLAGMAGLLLMKTDANFLNFGVSTCVVSFIIGTVLFLSGMYGKRGTSEQAAHEEMFRHSGRGAVAAVPTPDHLVSAHPGVAHKTD